MTRFGRSSVSGPVLDTFGNPIDVDSGSPEPELPGFSRGRALTAPLSTSGGARQMEASSAGPSQTAVSGPHGYLPPMGGESLVEDGSTDTGANGPSPFPPQERTAGQLGVLAAAAPSYGRPSPLPSTASYDPASPLPARLQMPPEYSIFVGHLGPEVDENLLWMTFSPVYHSFTKANLMRDPSTGNSRGYGFIRFTDERDRDHALTNMNNIIIGNSRIVVNHATNEQRQRGPPSGIYGLARAQYHVPQPPTNLNPHALPWHSSIGGEQSSGYRRPPETLRGVFQSLQLTGPPGTSSASYQPYQPPPQTLGTASTASHVAPDTSAPDFASTSYRGASGLVSGTTPTNIGPQSYLGGSSIAQNTSSTALVPRSYFGASGNQSYQPAAQQYPSSSNELTYRPDDGLSASPWYSGMTSAEQSMYGPNPNTSTIDHNNVTVFVGAYPNDSIDDATGKHLLAQIFQVCGQIVQINIPPGKGCAFVKYETHEQAFDAICRMQGTLFLGKRLRLSWGKHAKPQ